MGARTWFDGAVAPETTPAREWAEARPGSGTEHPDDLPDTAHLSIERTFCFADLTGFTRYTRENGPHAAVGLLATGGSTNHLLHVPAIARAAGADGSAHAKYRDCTC